MKMNQTILSYTEDCIRYQFNNKTFLLEALTHKSFCILENRIIPHNERFEFLGDAILGLIMAEQLMFLFPQDNEGMLSKKRASLINQETLAEKALAMKLSEFLILGPGEKAQGSHLKPRILASALEAIIGAIYLDSNFDTVKQWINDEFKNNISEIKPDLEYEKDYKTRLQELTYKIKIGTPIYELVSTTGPSHDPEFLVALKIGTHEKARASGKSKKIAEQKAAQIYIDELAVLMKAQLNHENNNKQKVKLGKTNVK
ncbi:MAG: ribonuclease III [Bdellovibrionaceae bacterium]|nr:ribonuclease III [Pseudobdellovibrionaceae bacterium]